MKYLVVIEKGASSYRAYMPDLPGCIAVGESSEEVSRLIDEAIEFHVEGLLEDGYPVPPPASQAELVMWRDDWSFERKKALPANADSLPLSVLTINVPPPVRWIERE